jgi:hypothetical protein
MGAESDAGHAYHPFLAKRDFGGGVGYDKPADCNNVIKSWEVRTPAG